jgi:predicted dithiol-disulfide oxidoreductase (DUF899 family)
VDHDLRGAPDLMPLWTILDNTPEGRGTNWSPPNSITVSRANAAVFHGGLFLRSRQSLVNHAASYTAD